MWLWFKPHCLAAVAVFALLGLNGCSYVIGSATQDFSDRLKQTLLDHNDPDTVAEAIPAYLLLMEASLAGDREDENALFSTANLYGSYLSLLPEQSPRKPRLSQKALDLAERGACVHSSELCGLRGKSIAELHNIVGACDRDDIDGLYSVATAWAAWIQAHNSDWNAVAQLVQVKSILQRILELEPHYKQGAPQLYMAVLESLVPPALGGQPELAKQYFEQAISLADGNLMASVLYAKYYARMMFDRDLHDKLLNSVLVSPVERPGLTLINTLAQQQARLLLDSGKGYF